MPILIFLYQILWSLSIPILKLISLFNPKLKKGIEGRKNTISKIKQFRKKHPKDVVIWFHCASLGEFEQALPLIQKIKKEKNQYKIAVSFFSPSGYEPQQNNDNIDLAFYLPFDQKSKLQLLIKELKPQQTFIVKYEFWYFLLAAHYQANIPVYLISAYFLEEQIFFKSYGKFHRNMLQLFNHIFVQDHSSKELLAKINTHHVSITGDTRIDQALLTKATNKPFDYIDHWIEKELIIAGSTWKEDIDLLCEVNPQETYQWIIAPHNINQENIDYIFSNFGKENCLLFTEITNHIPKEKSVLIINNYGILKHLYQFADNIWIGGGFNKSGIHNIIEAAVFEKNIAFGPNFSRFREATDLIKIDAVNSFRDGKSYSKHIENKEKQAAQKVLISNYISKQKGATDKIWNHCFI